MVRIATFGFTVAAVALTFAATSINSSANSSDTALSV
jgi:hypothetical protein